jgi:hypothetical protein
MKIHIILLNQLIVKIDYFDEEVDALYGLVTHNLLLPCPATSL